MMGVQMPVLAPATMPKDNLGSAPTSVGRQYTDPCEQVFHQMSIRASFSRSKQEGSQFSVKYLLSHMADGTDLSQVKLLASIFLA